MSDTKQVYDKNDQNRNYPETTPNPPPNVLSPIANENKETDTKPHTSATALLPNTSTNTAKSATSPSSLANQTDSALSIMTATTTLPSSSTLAAEQSASIEKSQKSQSPLLKVPSINNTKNPIVEKVPSKFSKQITTGLDKDISQLRGNTSVEKDSSKMNGFPSTSLNDSTTIGSETPGSLMPVFDTEKILREHQIEVLTSSQPLDLEEYSTHLNKLGSIIYENKFDKKFSAKLFDKFNKLMDSLEEYVDTSNPLGSQLHLLIEQNFDLFIRLSTNYSVIEVSTATIRFLTTVVMNLNYWEIYNLLNWKPVIYHFLNLINFDLNECYRKFISDYQNFTYDKVPQPSVAPKVKSRTRVRKRKRLVDFDDMISEERERTGRFFEPNPDTTDHDHFVADIVSGASIQKRKFRPDVKLEHHKIIKKPQPPTDKQSNKSSNYDPDVVHECQLPSAEEPHKLCLRRFSRKYELIRHQETVHSKKKKLFKCYVCVKQNPGVGPRIFTRHDTLAKHIRVNHEIFGKEAKAEVAYSKKHAEVVEEGDITVHVGRRKTKVDFELRAHMDKGQEDGLAYLETSDLESGEEEVVFNKR